MHIIRVSDEYSMIAAFEVLEDEILDEILDDDDRYRGLPYQIWPHHFQALMDRFVYGDGSNEAIDV